MMKIGLSVLMLMTFTCIKIFAQSNCAQTLRLARSTYDQGRLHELPTLLAGCLNGDFTQQEKVDAYKILTNAYIYLEEPEKADEAMLKLLQTDNEFEVNPEVDPAEFVALYKTFRTNPIYRIGIKVGTNVTKPNVVGSETSNEGISEYNFRFGFSGGLAGEIPIAPHSKTLLRNLTLNPELYYQIKSFDYTNTVDTSRTSIGPRSQNWIALPISVQYKIGQSKFNPYAALGVEVGYLFSSKVTAESKRPSNQPVESKTFDVTPDQNRFNISAIASIGAKLKVGKGMFVGELRYHQGLSNITKKEGTYSNPFLAFDYKVTDAIYKLNSMSITVGYLKNIYNPKKLTHHN